MSSEVFNPRGIPAYTNAGVASTTFMVVGSGTIGTAVTLSGSAAFTSSTSYTVHGTNLTHTGSTTNVTYTSGTSFNTTAAGGGGGNGDSFTYIAIGT